jgi:cytosine/creatinine deaminase
MLVLSRQRDQAIVIGDEIEVTVVDLRGDKVRLGITAPRTVSVHRKEVYDAIRRENQSAAGASGAGTISPGGLRGPMPPGASSRAGTTPVKVVSGDEAAEGTAANPSSTTSSSADPFLRAAIDEARKGLSEGGLPIGSVLVRNNQIIARGHNRRVQHGDPMAHAEIDCLKNAGRQKTYKDTVLYSTLMPCFLCTGAVIQFGIPKVIVGESVNFPGGHTKCGSSPQFMRDCGGVDVVDLHDAECIDMMSRFIREHPELWNEDIGVD